MVASGGACWPAALCLALTAGVTPAQVPEGHTGYVPEGIPEDVAAALESQQDQLFARLAAAPGRALSADELVLLLAPDAACSELLPGPGPALGSGAFELRRPAALPPGPVHRGRGDVAAELGRLAAAFRPPGTPQAPLALDVELGGIEPAGAGWLAELAYDARAGNLEQAARWLTRWVPAPGPGQAPLLAYAELLEFGSAARRASEAPFRDASAEVFGHLPAWRDDLARGFDLATAGLQRELRPGWDGHHGLAVGDADGDGRDDLFVCQPGGLPNRVFLQQPDGRAVEHAARLRLDLLDATAAALWLDLDGDGDQDLVTSVAGAVLVHEQRDFQGSPRFGLRAELPSGGASSLAAADFDLDGDLDLFAAGSDAAFDPERFPEPFEPARNGGPSRLFRSALSEGRWEFADATLEAGLGEVRGFVSAASFEDHDRDGDPDLFVADAFGPLRLFENAGGRFRDGTAAAGLEGLGRVHSLAWADVDRDGREELCAAAPALAGRSGGGLVWLDPAPAGAPGRFARAGRLEAGWVFGVAAFDLDQDGSIDLAAIGGLSSGIPGLEPLDRFFRRELAAPVAGPAYRAAFGALAEQLREGAALGGGQAGRAWLNAGPGSGPGGAGFLPAAGPLGLDERADGRALASVDWNQDGALDLVLTARSAPRLRLWLNQGAGSERALGIRLVGNGANRDAIGARVELETSQGPLALTLRAGGGFLSQSSKWLSATGPATAAAVVWPDGVRESFGGLAPGRWVLARGSGQAAAAPPPSAQAPAPGDEPAPAGGPAPGAGPGGAQACMLAVPVPLPALPTAAADGAPLSLSDPHPRPRLVLLPGVGAGALEPFAAARPEFERLGLELLPLADAGDALPRIADLCFEARGRDGPVTGLLIDPAGRLRAVYRGALDPAAVGAHARQLGASPEELRDAALFFPGRWHAAPPRADLPWLAERLREAGLAGAAAELEARAYEARELSPESMLTETALVRIRQGALEEAVRHLREALELAPDWPPALTHLGRALLALERPAEAALVLERALFARPRDALAQAELARACAELGLFEAADDLVYALGARDATGAASLAGELEGRRAAATSAQERR